MYYGDDVVVTKKGLIIKEKALLPVGIADNSICWGVELAPHPDKIGDQFPHLVISAFPPEHWHSLFQIVVRIKNTKGSLELAAKALNGLGINILSTQCAPSGHSHATWHLIGEDLQLKELFDKRLDDLFRHDDPTTKPFYDPQISVIDANGNDKFVMALEEQISQEAFKRSRKFEDFIFAKGKDNFLRLFCRHRDDESYTPDEKEEASYYKKSLLYTDRIFYDPELLEKAKEQSIKEIESRMREIRGEIKKIYSKLESNPSNQALKLEIKNLEKEKNAFEMIKEENYKNYGEMFRREEAETVISRWSKNMAVFRIYSQGNLKRGSKVNYNNPISFTYDASNELLTPRRDEDKIKYAQMVNDFASEQELPLGAIAAFDPQERYVRFVFPNRKKKISIKLKYAFSLGKTQDKSSIGLLKEVSEKIRKNDINLDYIENSIINYGDEKEEGVISLVGTFEDDRDDKVSKTIKYVKKELEEDLFKENQRESARFEAKVYELGVKQIFISTKFDFINEIKPRFKYKLKELVKECGFIPVFGDPVETPAKHDDPDLEAIISNRIRECDGFLLLIPKHLSAVKHGISEETEQAWLLYEFGVARGAGIPFEICVDEDKLDDYPIKIGLKWAKYRFNSSKDTNDILKEVRKALVSLRLKLYRSASFVRTKNI
jgi:hypothetical protein